MRGVTFLGERKLQLMEFPDPAPGPHDVVVEIKASGMCGSDLKFYRAAGGAASLGLGKVSGPVIGGHEPCGVVAATGSAVDERTARVGARIMVHHYTGCGTCVHCRTGWSQMCVEGSTVYGATGHGAHAPYMKVPADTLVDLPEELSFSTGAAISCGTGTAYQALRRMKVAGSDTIAVIGQGPVGLSATQLATAMGARVIALDISAERLARAKEFGADALINPQTDDPIAAIRAWQRDDRRESADAAQAAHHHRLMDFFNFDPGRMRALHHRPQDRGRSFVYRSLEARTGRRGLPAV
jgi:D-arabinose 1-dehydrogenase-like Zn-dependent alcohol dehydrogenase